MITSAENRWLKRFRQALRAGEPTEEGFIAVEGARLVREALAAGLEVAAVLVSTSGGRHLESLRPTPGGSLRVLRTTDRLFDGVADTRTPQGIAALVRPRTTNLEDMLSASGEPLVVVLAEVQDPGNVGTIVRSAEAFGASGAIACRGTSNPFAPKALRASAGSALRLPVLQGGSAGMVMAQLRMSNLRICAASLEAGVHPAEADLREPFALVIGNEGAGLPAEVARSADVLLRIPIEASVDSLNAGVAASVLLYEAARQRAARP